MVKIGFIGMGNMGNAILNGLLKTHRPEDMIFSAAHQDKMEAVTARTKVPHAGSNRECAKAVKYLILAVKPQYFDAVFSEIRDVVTPEQVVISLAPGVTISNITERLGGNVRVVRAMPNTPAMLGEGMTGISCGEGSCTEEEKETVRDIFSSCGRVEMVEERLMDAVGCVSGSSPAFVYMFIEALADGGVKRPSQKDCLCHGSPDCPGQCKNDSGDRKASGAVKGRGVFSGRHHHCGRISPGGARAEKCAHQGGGRLL